MSSQSSLTILLGILLAAPALADPEIVHAPIRSDEAEAVVAAEIAIPLAPLPVGWPETLEIPAVEGIHAGEVRTVVPLSGEPALTPGEIAKLEVARAAVEAARASRDAMADVPPEVGIDVDLPAPRGNPSAPLTDWEKAKLDGLTIPRPEHFPNEESPSREPTVATEEVSR